MHSFIQAGHYTKHLLYLAGASFAVTVALLILIPSYGIGLLAITGCILLSCNALFCLLYPRLLNINYVQSGASDRSLGFEDGDFRSSPGWWGATVATYCPSRPGELPTFLSSKPLE